MRTIRWTRRLRALSASQDLATVTSNVLSTATTATLVIGLSASAGLNAVGDLTLTLVPLTVSLAIQRTALIQTFLSPKVGATRPTLLLIVAILATLAAACVAVIVVKAGLRPILFLSCVATVLSHIYDATRYIKFARRAAWSSVPVDGVLLAVTAAGPVMFLVLSWVDALAIIMIAWTAGLVVVTAAGTTQFREAQFPTRHGPGLTFVALVSIETAVTLAIPQALTLVLGLVVDREELGQFRLAQMAIAPIAILALSMLASRAAEGAMEANRERVANLSLTAIAIAGAALVWVNPFDLIVTLGVDNSPVFAEIVLTLAAAAILSARNYMAMIDVRPRVASWRWLTTRASMSGLEPGVGIIAAYYFGALGAASGILVHQCALYAFLRLRTTPFTKAGRFLRQRHDVKAG